jgi:hypothetical protein
MANAKYTISINRPVDEVFKFILEGENNALWRPSVIDIKNISGGNLGVGTTFAQGLKGPFGRRISGDYVITGCEKDKTITFQVIKGPARPMGTYDFEHNGMETVVTFALSFNPKGIARLMDPMIKSQMELEVSNLVNLKKYLETK